MKTNSTMKVIDTLPSNLDLSPETLISLEESKRILNKNGMNYTDEEIQKIREFIFRVIEISLNQYRRMKESSAKIISITKPLNPHETESIPLYSGQHRRAG